MLKSGRNMLKTQLLQIIAFTKASSFRSCYCILYLIAIFKYISTMIVCFNLHDNGFAAHMRRKQMHEEGIVTVRPTRLLHSWNIQVRLDSGMLMEFEMVSAKCDINPNERIRIIFYPPLQEGDLPKAEEIYSITRGRKVFPKIPFFRRS